MVLEKHFSPARLKPLWRLGQAPSALGATVALETSAPRALEVAVALESIAAIRSE